MAKKKPGKKKTAKSKARKGPARTKRPAKKTAARKKTATAAKKKARASTKKAKSARPKTKSARPSSTKKKTKKALKSSPAAKKKSAAKSSAKAKKPAAAAKSKSSTKSAKTPAAAAKAPAAAKGSTKKAATSNKKGVKAPPVPDAQGYVIINGRRVRMISTKGLTIPKRAATTTDNGDKDSELDRPKKARKSRLSPKDLEHFRELLLLHRRQLAGDLTAMESEALNSGGGNMSHMPIHMADIGSDTFDQDFMLGLAANERGLLKEIDDALARIESGEYGICAATGNPIPKSRLNAKPWAKYTVEAARMIERGLNAS